MLDFNHFTQRVHSVNLLDNLRIPELREEYKKRGLKNYSKLKKQELVDKIKDFDRLQNHLSNHITDDIKQSVFSSSNTDYDYAQTYNFPFYDYTQEKLDDQRLNLYLLTLKITESNLINILRKGDIICLDPKCFNDINNNSKLIWNGERCLYLEFNILDNGTIQPDFYVDENQFHPFYWKPALNNCVFFLSPRLLRSLRFTTTNFTTKFRLSGIMYRWKVFTDENIFPFEKEEKVNLLLLDRTKAYYCDASGYDYMDNNSYIMINIWEHYYDYHTLKKIN